MSKTISIKMVGAGRPIENRRIEAGTTTRDVLASLSLEGGGFQLSDSTGSRIYGMADNLYAAVEDGALLMCSALVDAGEAA